MNSEEEKARIKDIMDLVGDTEQMIEEFPDNQALKQRKRHLLMQLGGTDEISLNRFNEEFPIGTRVRFWPGSLVGRVLHGEIQSKFWNLGGTPVALISGYSGGIAASHIKKVENQPQGAYEKYEKIEPSPVKMNVCSPGPAPLRKSRADLDYIKEVKE